MDLELYARVVWRHRRVAAAGLAVAIVLALLSYVRVGPSGIGYRDQEQWLSKETVSVTQPGFTEGRLSYSGADPSRLTMLAVLYSHYIDADAVRAEIWPRRVRGESVEAAPVLTLPGSSSASALPIISIAAFSGSPSKAQALAERATGALRNYIAARQARAHVPVAERVQLEPVQRASSNLPELWQGRSRALPIVVFLTAAVATVALAFILENLSPQIRPIAAPEEKKRVARRPRAS